MHYQPTPSDRLVGIVQTDNRRLFDYLRNRFSPYRITHDRNGRTCWYFRSSRALHQSMYDFFCRHLEEQDPYSADEIERGE